MDRYGSMLKNLSGRGTSRQNINHTNEFKLLQYFEPAERAQKLHQYAFRENSEYLSDLNNFFKSGEENELARVKNMFFETSKDIEVKNIKKIMNPFLYLSFLLRKCEYNTNNLGNEKSQVREMFHATKKVNMTKIISQNFNWRLRKKCKYGKGVSFSSKSNYARRFGHDGHMIVAYVLIKNSCLGKWGMKIPPLMRNNKRYDTTTSKNDDVHVKYRDDEFYPIFWITYIEKEHYIESSSSNRLDSHYDDYSDYDYDIY